MNAYMGKISAFAATDDLTQIAVGFGNGAVTVIRGDLIHDLGTKQRIVFESEEPVTGVQLAVDEKLTTLFVSTHVEDHKARAFAKGTRAAAEDGRGYWMRSRLHDSRFPYRRCRRGSRGCDIHVFAGRSRPPSSLRIAQEHDLDIPKLRCAGMSLGGREWQGFQMP